MNSVKCDRAPEKIHMSFNPYESSADCESFENSDSFCTGNVVSKRSKYALIVIGMMLYFSNVQRDAHFYRTILDNEGFPTRNDSIAIGIAGSLISTLVFTPLALFLIWYGFTNCKRLQFVPWLERSTLGWGVLSSILVLMMLRIEADYLIYAAQRPHHWKTLLTSSVYVTYIYVWWCNSLAHGESRKNSTAKWNGVA